MWLQSSSPRAKSTAHRLPTRSISCFGASGGVNLVAGSLVGGAALVDEAPPDRRPSATANTATTETAAAMSQFRGTLRSTSQTIQRCVAGYASRHLTV